MDANMKVMIFILGVYNRLNCSFSPLTFPKLRFWPPKKKNYKTAPLSFATVAVLAPQGKKIK